MGVREGLLALLDREPSHGYRLRAELEDTVGDLWSLNVGQVYSTLQRLERDDLVAADGEPDDDGRVPYLLTDDGREDVTAWLRAPLARDADVRDELVLKILLARRTGLVDPLGVIDAQRETTIRSLQEFTRRRAALDDDQIGRRLSLDRLALTARAELDFLELAEERLAAAGPPPEPPAASPDDQTTDATAAAVR